MYHIGVDLGGTNIKVGIVDDAGTLLRTASLPTDSPRSAESVSDDIIALIFQVAKEQDVPFSSIEDIGVGCPGTINPHSGIVEYANNLGWWNFHLREYLAGKLPEPKPVYVENDANVAALGEYYAGSARGAASVVVITIGTGLGSGAILNSKMLNGHFYGGGEMGHTVIEFNGRPCTCGRKGCLEAYASATGLIELTKEEMEASPDSVMHKLVGEKGKVSGKTAFDAMKQGDAAGARVVDSFLSYLACGVTNIINTMQPEVLSIGGGVSKEGDFLLGPLREKVEREIYGGADKPHTDLRICTLGNDAGIIGAAMLGRLEKESHAV